MKLTDLKLGAIYWTDGTVLKTHKVVIDYIGTSGVVAHTVDWTGDSKELYNGKEWFICKDMIEFFTKA